ncbi:MAG TPA: class I SAM-dependent methyltransferase [Longimicrobiales bacterium]|nr:class I SAM-dependent methyltransferase [Longimicrobiales bacterium]
MIPPLRPDIPCAVCRGHAGNRVIEAREMMFGLRDPFHYLECGSCGCLALLDPPADWSRYYPGGYYAFVRTRGSPLRKLLKRMRARHDLGEGSVLGAILSHGLGPTPWVEWLAPAGIGREDAVLDVGSGNGLMLEDMRDAGFCDLTGVDPYIARDLDLGPGARVLKRSLEEVEGPFAFIMMNHSFEHMPDPESVLAHLARLLPPERYLMIRMPVAGTHAWRTYGADWVQLDAPRHQFVHTEASVASLAARTGFRVDRVVYDSTAFQFWGSEQYRRDVPLESPGSYLVRRSASFVRRRDVTAYTRTARELNQSRDGDQACFYLVRTDP